MNTTTSFKTRVQRMARIFVFAIPLAVGLAVIGPEPIALAVGALINGEGSANRIPKFTGSYTIANSQLFDNGTNVGIGTTAPATKVHVSGSSNDPAMRIENTTNSTSSIASVQLKTSASSNVWQWFARNGDLFGGVANVADYLVIKSDGKVGIGTASPLGRLSVAAKTVGDGIQLVGTTAGGLTPALGFYDSATERGSICLAEGNGHCSTQANTGDMVFRASSGKMLLQTGTGASSLTIVKGNVGIGTISPAQKLDVAGNMQAYQVFVSGATRQKDDILPLDNAASRLDCVSGVSYRAKGSRAADDLQLGFVGEDLEACFPELVATDAEGDKSVDYARLVVPLIEVAKEQQQINQDLEGQLASTNARLARLEARLATSR